MPHNKELIELDFHEHDTVAALRYLIQQCDAGNISGIVFGCAMKRGKRPMFGATGRLASNGIEAAGMAGILHNQLVKPYNQ